MQPHAAVAWPPGRHGRGDGAAGASVRLRHVAGAASLHERAAGGLASALGIALPTGAWVEAAGLTYVWTGPGKHLVFGGPDIVAMLRERAHGLASVTDQTDARAVLRLSGPRARDVLAKGVALDLHPRVFRAGQAATTLVAHLSVLLWQIDDGPTYDMAVARSYAGSFCDWLLASGAEYGLDIA